MFTNTNQNQSTKINLKPTNMRFLCALILAFFFGTRLFGQEDKIKELVAQGTELHDQGKYDDAILKYQAALALDENSTLANYELSYTYMVTKQYEKGIKYSNKVLEQKSDNQHGAYIVLGSCLDMSGEHKKAISAYEEGLTKFPNSNLLNYNLALTLYNQKDYAKAENACVKAIIVKSSHGSSHILLAAIMQSLGNRVKSLLPLYYFLMLEPNSERSLANYNNLRSQLGLGVEKKDEQINVTVPFSTTTDSIFGAADMSVSLLAASRFTEENKNKSEMEFFVETNKGLFSILGELKKGNAGFWWDTYVAKFYDLVQSNNYEAFTYYISQSANSEAVKNWIAENNDKMQNLIGWMGK